MKNTVEMKIYGKEIIKNQGDVLIMPQDVDRSVTGKGDVLLLEVSKSCQPNDNIFKNKNISGNGIL